MQITSPQPTGTITVCDLDVRFPGESYSGTLYPADTFELTDDEILIRFGLGELVTIHLDAVLWISRCEREITRPLRNPNAATKESRHASHKD